MSHITTHILDLSRGRPAADVGVKLFATDEASERLVGQARTDADGRVADGLIDDSNYRPGVYRIEFATEEYFRANNEATFYPVVCISFRVAPNEAHYHVPVLLSAFGYSTYRGS